MSVFTAIVLIEQTIQSMRRVDDLTALERLSLEELQAAKDGLAAGTVTPDEAIVILRRARSAIEAAQELSR